MLLFQFLAFAESEVEPTLESLHNAISEKKVLCDCLVRSSAKLKKSVNNTEKFSSIAAMEISVRARSHTPNGSLG